MGINWCTFRVWYVLKLRSGWFRGRCPAKGWGEIDLVRELKDPELVEPEVYSAFRQSDQAPTFFFSPEDREVFQPLFAQWDHEASPVTEADAILRGLFQFYSKEEKDVRFPPEWHSNAVTGERASASSHWSDLGDFGFGDIKNIWEVSRFGWAYALVRAYWRTDDERYPEAFWALFENWVAKNPPNQGVNWKCGQEVSFRVMAWCFALYGFLDSRSTTAERLQSLLTAMAISGDRIAANIDYAISQKNNHGISEGMGLWTIGILFPELKQANKWRERGRRVLEDLARELIYADGSFSQHSMNYHRVMLHDYLWAVRLGDLNGEALSDQLRAKVAAAGDFLWRCQDDISGAVPLFGANDGAHILPLSNCDYRDFRPAVTMARFFSSGERTEENGPWEESLLWLWGRPALGSDRSKEKRPASFLSATGYLTLRDEESFLFSRAGSYRHRPSEADALHVDIWWRGLNIAGDAGTFSYNAPPPWDGVLKRTAVHNTLCIDGADQMEKVGRFLWLPWSSGGWRRIEGNDGRAWVEGWHDGYRRLKPSVIHRRAILSAGTGFWIVVDRAKSSGSHQYDLHWLLDDFPLKRDGNRGGFCLGTRKGDYYLTLGSTTPMDESELSVVRGDPHSPRGWRSAYYQTREEALSIRLRKRAQNVTFISVFSPIPVRIESAPDGFTVTADRQNFLITLEAEAAGVVVRSFTARPAVLEKT